MAEAAAAMGCSEGSVKTHCSRAVHALAVMLKAKGLTAYDRPRRQFRQKINGLPRRRRRRAQGRARSIGCKRPGRRRSRAWPSPRASARPNRGWRMPLPGAGGSGTGGGRGLLTSVRLWLGIAIIVAAAFGYQQWQVYQQTQRIEELDAQILSSDLPIDAYLDQGFRTWLTQRRTVTAALGLALALAVSTALVPIVAHAQITMRSPSWSQLTPAGTEGPGAAGARLGQARRAAQAEMARPGPALPHDGAGRAAAHPAADAIVGEAVAAAAGGRARAIQVASSNCRRKRRPKSGSAGRNTRACRPRPSASSPPQPAARRHAGPRDRRRLPPTTLPPATSAASPQSATRRRQAPALDRIGARRADRTAAAGLLPRLGAALYEALLVTALVFMTGFLMLPLVSPGHGRDRHAFDGAAGARTRRAVLHRCSRSSRSTSCGAGRAAAARCR